MYKICVRGKFPDGAIRDAIVTARDFDAAIKRAAKLWGLPKGSWEKTVRWYRLP